MAQVFIPASLRKLTGGTRSVELDVHNVRAAVAELESRFPGIRDRLCDGDRLRPEVAVSVDSVLSGKGLLQAVGPDSEVHFILSVGGG